jgi:hypothetical protein
MESGIEESLARETKEAEILHTLGQMAQMVGLYQEAERLNTRSSNLCQIKHSRHRSPINFLVNLVVGLIASCHQPKKPSLALQPLVLPGA